MIVEQVKRRPGRPSTGQNLVRVDIQLRREQHEWLKEFAERNRKYNDLNSISVIIRGLIDGSFAKNG